jgi:hypothetical protein
VWATGADRVDEHGEILDEVGERRRRGERTSWTRSVEGVDEIGEVGDDAGEGVDEGVGPAHEVDRCCERGARTSRRADAEALGGPATEARCGRVGEDALRCAAAQRLRPWLARTRVKADWCCEGAEVCGSSSALDCEEAGESGSTDREKGGFPRTMGISMWSCAAHDKALCV